MRSRIVVSVVAVVLLLLGAQAASAKEQYVYSVKFVCGYNPTNVGVSHQGVSEGEPPVKFGNYATEINILWPELYIEGPAFVFKHIVLLVERGVPVGREPRVISARPYLDSVQLNSLQATMDDCNRIAELLYGAVPTPLPLLVGYFVITSTHELDVTAVYTAETCGNWVVSPVKLDCLNPNNQQAGVSVSIDVERIPARKLLLQ
ncbi:MAG TPA: hypothetical protein VGX68_15940 [Thermoanaerobaculia bacterium]|jgi:hypothetical protein|nr:hypothetical protein [Thermoanaerobaculia bacterium]